MSFFTQLLALFRKGGPRDNFTPRALQTIGLARHIALRNQDDGVEPEHMLAGLLTLNHGIGVLALKKFGIDPQELKSTVEHSFLKGTVSVDANRISFHESAKRCLALAAREARMMRNILCGTEHLLLGILRQGQSAAAELLSSLGFTLERARLVIRKVQAEEAEREPNQPPQL